MMSREPGREALEAAQNVIDNHAFDAEDGFLDLLRRDMALALEDFRDKAAKERDVAIAALTELSNSSWLPARKTAVTALADILSQKINIDTEA